MRPGCWCAAWTGWLARARGSRSGRACGRRPAVSTRVLLSLREHLLNRAAPVSARVFVNQGSRAWVTDDEREPLSADTVAALAEVLDTELAARLPRCRGSSWSPRCGRSRSR